VPSVGTWFVEVVPSFRGMAAKMQAESVPIAAESGAKAGASFSSAFTKETVSGSQRMAAAVAAQAKTAEAAVSAASGRVVAARAREEDAAGRVRVAEAKLAEARAKYAADSSQVIGAEERLAAAQRSSTTASAATQSATAKLAAAKSATVTATTEESKAVAASNAILAKNASVIATLTDGVKKYGALIGAVIVADMGVKAVKAAGDFEQSQERLVTTAGELQSNLALVDAGVLKMAGDVGYSAQTLSKGLYTVESAGFHGADALRVMQAAAEGAKAENADLTTVTDAVTSAMRDYHLGATQSADVTSKLVTAVSLGKTTFEQLTGAMSAILPKASAAGVSLEEILGDMSAMTLHGTTAEQASQNLADALTHLVNPTLAMTKEMAALGLSSADLSKNIGKTGISGAMLEIEQAILQHMGPAGTTLLNVFNQSKQAAQDAKTMFDALPPAAHKVAAAVMDGSLSFTEFRKTGGGLAVSQKALVDQWLTMFKSANGFNDALKSGGNASQTFSQAMAKATGDSASLNVALMLTGENADIVQGNIKAISASAAEAGGHVKGWSEVQGTFNQKIDEIKAGMGAWLIQMGTNLLPALTEFLGFLQGIPRWLSDNKDWLLLLASAAGGAALAFVAMKIATFDYVAVAKAAQAAVIGLNVAMRANPVMLIVTAVAALVAALVYAWFHFAKFREIVEAVWHAVEAAGKAIWSALVTAFTAVVDAAKVVRSALVTAFNAIVAAVKVVGAAFSWFWDTILKPTFNVISIAVRVLAGIFLTILILPVYFAVKYLLAPLFTWLWESVIRPVFGFIAGIAVWLWGSVLKPTFDAIGVGAHAVGSFFVWLWANAIKPALDAIGVAVRATGEFFNWLWNNAISPAINAIGVGANWLWTNAIKPAFDAVKAAVGAVGDVFTWLWHTIIEPVWHGIQSVVDKVGGALGTAFDGIKSAVHAVGDAFSAVATGIGTAWDGVKKAVAAPINWVIQHVYNDGIRAVWNGVAGFLGLDSLKLPPANLVQFAGGGVIGGYQPGRDVVHAVLSPGEAVLVPELVRQIGPANILAANAAASGRPGTTIGGFSGGGVVAGDWEPARFAGGGVIGDILSVIGNVGKNVLDIFTDPIGFVTRGVGGAGNWLAEIAHIPGKFIGNIGSWLWSKITSFADAAIHGNFAGAAKDAFLKAVTAFTGVGGSWIGPLDTLITRESGWNPKAINLTDINAQNGDPSRGLAQVIMATFQRYRDTRLPNDIYDPGANVVASINYIKDRYGDIHNVQQADASQPPMGYDSGGWLMPGVTPTVNATGRPEAVLTESQWNTLSRAATRGDEHNAYYITTHDPESVVAEMQRRKRFAMAREQ